MALVRLATGNLQPNSTGLGTDLASNSLTFFNGGGGQGALQAPVIRDPRLSEMGLGVQVAPKEKCPSPAGTRDTRHQAPPQRASVSIDLSVSTVPSHAHSHSANQQPHRRIPPGVSHFGPGVGLGVSAYFFRLRMHGSSHPLSCQMRLPFHHPWY